MPMPCVYASLGLTLEVVSVARFAEMTMHALARAQAMQAPMDREWSTRVAGKRQMF